MINKDWPDHENFTARLVQANLARKNDFANFEKKKQKKKQILMIN